MVLKAGLISAFIVFKKKRKQLTRLQNLQKKLEKKPLKSVILYEFPSKKLFQIFMIVLFIYCLQIFKNSYLGDMKQQMIEEQIELERKKIQNVLYWLKIGYSSFVLFLLISLSLKTVNVENNMIKINKYPSIEDGSEQNLQVSGLQNKDYNIYIVQYSRDKFSHYLNYFTIEIQFDYENSSIEILRRSDVFHARKSLIQLCSVLKRKPSLKIKQKRFL